jgi:hypothetical protein
MTKLKRNATQRRKTTVVDRGIMVDNSMGNGTINYLKCSITSLVIDHFKQTVLPLPRDI